MFKHRKFILEAKQLKGRLQHLNAFSVNEALRYANDIYYTMLTFLYQILQCCHSLTTAALWDQQLEMKIVNLGNVEPLGHWHTVRRDVAGIWIQISVNMEHSWSSMGSVKNKVQESSWPSRTEADRGQSSCAHKPVSQVTVDNLGYNLPFRLICSFSL